MTVNVEKIYEVLNEFYNKYPKKFQKILDILISKIIRPHMNDELCFLLFIIIQYKSFLEKKNNIIYIVPSGRPHNISYFGAYNNKNIDIYYGKLIKRKLYQEKITLISNHLAYNMISGELTVHFKVSGENLCKDMKGGVVVFKKGIDDAEISNVKGGKIIIEGDSNKITINNITNTEIIINSPVKKLVVKDLKNNARIYINKTLNDFDFQNIKGHIYINYQIPNDKLDTLDRDHVHVPQDFFMKYIQAMYEVSQNIEKHTIKRLDKKVLVEEPKKTSNKKIFLGRLKNLLFGKLSYQFSKTEVVEKARKLEESLKNVFAFHGVVIDGEEFPINIIEGSLEFFNRNKEWIKNKLHITNDGTWKYFSNFLVSYSKAWTGKKINADEVPDYFGYFLLGQKAIIKGTITSNNLGYKMSSGELIIDKYENTNEEGKLGFQMSGGKITADKIKANSVGYQMSGGKITADKIKANSVGYQMSGGEIKIGKLEKLSDSISVGGGTGGEIIINEPPEGVGSVSDENKTKITILKKNE